MPNTGKEVGNKSQKLSKMTTLNNISRKEQREMINAYIIDSIDDIMSDGDTQANTPHEKVNMVWECFLSESDSRINNYQLRLADWFQGLPSCISIAFDSCDILALAEKWGSDVSTEKKQDFICANWFNYMACKFIQLRTKLNKL